MTDKFRKFSTASAARSYGQRVLGGLNTAFGPIGPGEDGKYVTVAYLRDDQDWMVKDLEFRGLVIAPISMKPMED